MKLRELLGLIENIAANSGISPVYICGGASRDKVLNTLQSGFNDLDITTGDKTIHNLAKELSIELSKKYSIKSTRADDGHTSIVFPGNDFKLDCSSNFVVPNIDEILYHKGIKSPTDLQREMFSRDFTCNALLMTLDLKTIKDPTHLGLTDIKQKILKTCLDIDASLRYNPNRIIRIVYLSAKLNFDVDPQIINWVIKNKNMVRLSTDKYLTKNIDKAILKDPERTVFLLNKMNLWDVIPITNNLIPYQTKKAQFRTNYDYGEGLFMNLEKYKSVSDFRRKRRKKRLKELKNIKNMKLK